LSHFSKRDDEWISQKVDATSGPRLNSFSLVVIDCNESVLGLLASKYVILMCLQDPSGTKDLDLGIHAGIKIGG
jgi:hypothetical protein